MKFAANGPLYRGSKPVMWSVVEKTALAEAEVEYEDYTSDHGLGEVSGRSSRPAKSPAARATCSTRRIGRDLDHHAMDFPGNRAISFSPQIAYGLYEVTEAPRRQLGQSRRQIRSGR